MTPNFHRLLTGDVAAGLADARDDLVKHPAFKFFCCRELAVRNQAVNVSFRDKLYILFAAHRKESAFYRPLTMLSKSISRPGSLTMLISCCPPGVCAEYTPFSSSSKRRVCVRSIPSALHTSAATNHGSPSSVTARGGRRCFRGCKRHAHKWARPIL